MIKSYQYLTYFLFVTLAMICGIGIAMIHGYVVNPEPEPLNSTELHNWYNVQTSYAIPHMQKIFPLLTIFNIGVSIIVLMFPLYWIWVVRFSSNLLTPESVPMKATVYFLILAVGHNTFYKSYVAFKTIPTSIFTTMYYPHAFLEIFAYILAGVFSLMCIDQVREYIRTHECMQNLHPGDLSLFILHRVWYGIIIVAVLLILAAFVECYVTPGMVYLSMKTYFEA